MILLVQFRDCSSHVKVVVNTRKHLPELYKNLGIGQPAS